MQLIQRGDCPDGHLAIVVDHLVYQQPRQLSTLGEAHTVQALTESPAKLLNLTFVAESPVQTGKLALQLAAALLKRSPLLSDPLRFLSHHEVSVEPLAVALHQSPLLFG